MHRGTKALTAWKVSMPTRAAPVASAGRPPGCRAAGRPRAPPSLGAPLLPGAPRARPPAPTRAAGRSALLLADALLVSAASGSLGREILVARFYVNELFFSTEEVVRALEAEDVPRALDAWALGVDSYNSYFTVVNPRIVPKVGEQFAPVRA